MTCGSIIIDKIENILILCILIYRRYWDYMREKNSGLEMNKILGVRIQKV